MKPVNGTRRRAAPTIDAVIDAITPPAPPPPPPPYARCGIDTLKSNLTAIELARLLGIGGVLTKQQYDAFPVKVRRHLKLL